MKTKATCFKLLIAFMLTLVCKVSIAANEHNCYIANDHLTSPTTYEWDVYIQSTSNNLIFRSCQFGFQFNTAFIPAGATIVGSYDPAFSELVTPYGAGAPQWNATVNCMSCPSMAANSCFTPPGPGPSFTTLTVAGGPKRIVRFKITSDIPFPCAPPNISMIRVADPLPAPGVLKVATSIATSPTNCLAVTITSSGTFSSFGTPTVPAATLTNLINNLNEISVSAVSPATAQLCAGTGVQTFSVTATGNGTATPLSYQWSLNGSPLTDGPNYQGTHTASLVVTNPASGGSITCQVSQCSPTTGTPTSVAATLNVVVSDDGNACTIDACNPATGNVTHTPIPVDDNNACTADACDPASGSISHTPGNISDNNECTTDACDPTNGSISHTPVLIDDNNVCTVDACDAATGAISHTLGNFTDGNPCTTDGCNPVTGPFHNPTDFSDANLCDIESCNPANGNITHTPVNINDNNECTIDACVPATGAISHTQVSIDDLNLCTTDACNPANGNISHTPITTTDNNACTDDVCDPGTGNVAHNPVAITDNDACTTDACNPGTGAITHTAVNINDNNACTTDACDPTTGSISHTAVVVDDNNACTNDVCNITTGVITHPALVTIDDHDACTVDNCDIITGTITHPAIAGIFDTDMCTQDLCAPATGIITHPPIAGISDNNLCTQDNCDPSTGITAHPPIAGISDNDLCTQDNCAPATGITAHPPIAGISDGDMCTQDLCAPATGVISHPALAAIDDNNACTTDNCVPGTGAISHTAINTSDNNACTTDACDPGTGSISHTPVSIEDNNACTDDACNTSTGAITHTALVAINDNNACTTDACDQANGTITHNAIPTDDNNLCTNDGCNQATGVFHNPINVDDGNGCTVDACDPLLGESHTANPNIDDHSACTTDNCDPATGVITHPPIAGISDNNPCTQDLCDAATGAITNPPLASINDGNLCTDDNCDVATGIVTHSPKAGISDGNPCTQDLCEPATGVITNPPLASINDGNLCTDDNCDPASGTITHLPIAGISDNNLCTQDNCNPSTGITAHPPIAGISDNNMCTQDLCDAASGSITHPPLAAIDDNSVCTNDNCVPATGVITHTPINTSDNNLCTQDLCDPQTGISHPAIAGIDDQNICTTDACNTSNGTITHTAVFTAGATSTPAGCNQSGSVSATPNTAGYTYLWSNNLGTAQTVNGVQPGTYTVTVTNATGCTSTATTTVAGNGGGGANPPGPITGPTLICDGQRSVVYCVEPVPGAISYQWTLPNGVVGYTTSNCITVRISSRFSSTGGQICVKTVSSCGTSTPTCLTIKKVTAPPATPGPISGPISLCPNATGPYTIQLVPNATGYEWATTNGLIILTGQGTNSVTIKAPAGFISGQIKVRAKNCKGNSAYRILNITGLAPAPVWDFDHAGDNATMGVCAGTTHHYEVHFNSAITCYLWTAPPGALIHDNNGGAPASNPYTVNSSHDDVDITFPAGFVSGLVTVSSCNSACGPGSTIQLFVQSTPNQPGPISGLSAGVCNSSNQVYQIAAVTGATSYVWTFPAGVQVTNTSNGGRTKTVKFLAAFTGGNACVTANNACGAGPQTCLAISAAPAKPDAITGGNNIMCKSATNIQYQVNTVPSATSYNWTATNGVVITSGQGTRTVRVRFNSSTQNSTVLSVTASNACGQSPASTRTIAINTGCRNADAVEASGSDNVIGSLTAYPNPTSGKATITFNSDNSAKYVLKVIDVLGKTMIFENVTAVSGYNMKEIDLSGVAKGMYFVTIQSEGRDAETLRLVVE